MTSKDIIDQLVESKREKMVHVSDQIWEAAELGMKEYRSVDAIVSVLKQEGFAVQQGLAGIPTAFSGRFGAGKPIIGFLGEFDALPNLSQQAGVAHKAPTQPGGNGHGCGHNALGAGALAAAVALKDYLEQNKMPGTVIYFGCPGEEFGCGKAFMARDGCFDELDCAFTWHPSTFNSIWNTSSLANISVLFDFEGKTAHAAAAPHLGRSALDAAELMNVGVNFLREHIIQEARVHYAFHDVGGQAPNVVQDRARLHYYIRAPKQQQAREIYERVIKVAQGAAMMTDTTCTVRPKDGLSDYIPNQVLSTVLGDALIALGKVPFDEQDYLMAQSFRDSLSEEEYNNSLRQLAMYGSPELIAEYSGKVLFDDVLPYRPSNAVLPGSADVGDVSYVVPVAQALGANACIGTSPHTWQQTAQSKSEFSNKTTLHIAKAMALAAVTVLQQPELLQKAKEEHLQNTGGKKYQALFPDDVMPTLD